MLRRFTLLLALSLVFAACTGTGESTTTAGEVTSTTQGAGNTSAPPDQTTTSAGPVTTTAPDLSGVEGISDEVRAQLEELIRQAQEVRELPFLSPPVITVVSEDELEARVREDIAEEAVDIPADEALYEMLGLLNEEGDLEQILLDLYGEQVAGFYDGDTGEIVVPAREDGFSVLQRGTMVHELVHALTDQHFSFDDDFQAMIDEERLDEASAYQALIEGDASLAEVLWLQTLSQSEIGEFLAEGLNIDTAVFDAAPRFLRESLTFPYDSGLAFVQDLYLGANGWSQVNEAYSEFVELPGSTEQVITPDDYQRDLPISVEIPDVTVAGYELERTSVWGEQGFRLLLNQGVTEATMPQAADGWGGDSYHQWFNGQDAALLIVFRGDSQSETDELEQALVTFANQTFPEDHFVWVDQLEGDLYFIASDDQLIGEKIRADVGLG